jgi:hypothetical protein
VPRPDDKEEKDNRDAAYIGGTPSESGMSSVTTQNPSEISARGERHDVEREERKRERRSQQTKD